jgi:hypothetical protein
MTVVTRPRTYPLTIDGLRAALNNLGNTETEVIDTLTRLGCHGRRGSEHHCPIAVYLRQVYGLPAAQIWVCATVVFVDFPGEGRAVVMNAPHTRAAVYAFDHGRHPDLELAGEGRPV